MFLSIFFRHKVLPEIIIEILIKESTVHIKEDVFNFTKGNFINQ